MVDFSYSNTGGSGNRSASIPTVTQLAGTAAVVANLVNGTFGSTDVAFANDNWSVQFDFGTSKYIPQAMIWTTTTGNFVIRWSGSANGSAWTQIGSDETYTADMTDGTKGNGFVVTCLRGNQTAYRYYKMERISGPSTMNMREVEFYIDGGGGRGVPYVSTRYPVGSGDRTALTANMALTTNKTSSAGTLNNLVDGVITQNSSDAIKFNNAENDTYIQFDFDVDYYMDRFRFQGFYGSSNTHGSWNILGSNNAWAGSSVVQGAFGTPGGPASDFTTTLSSPGWYRSYRLINVSGTSFSNSQWVTEFDFRLSPDFTFTPLGGGGGGGGNSPIIIITM